jgi:tRNA1Val (adenine37-N6)-methyltransferase
LKPFRFKQFEIYHNECAMKVGTDGVLIGAWADVSKAQTILDIGTGTGLIAIMAAQKNKNAQIIGIDIDKSAVKQALKNVKLCAWNERLQIKHLSIQSFKEKYPTSHFDAIVSNPPFFKAGSKAPQHQRHIARHAAILSHVDLIQSVKQLLSSDGKFSLVLPTLEGKDFQLLALEYGLYLTRICKVHSKKNKPVERLLMEFQKRKSPLISENLIIQHEARNDWTDEYIRLTRAFYLKM